MTDPSASPVPPNLRHETENLSASWMQHDSEMLRDYLVSDVEDPRLNVQSVLSRHFLLSALFGTGFDELAAQELRFAAFFHWFWQFLKSQPDADQLASVLHALRCQSDNAEGMELPLFVVHAFQKLPAAADGCLVPNYIEASLVGALEFRGEGRRLPDSAACFQNLWRCRLAHESPAPISVVEPACGSANDFRFLHEFGLDRLLQYRGFDLCSKNIENARSFFPEAHFDLGNVFAIELADHACDFCFFHDLLEHLSLEGLARAISEICRVTALGICGGFFSVYEDGAHIVRPVEKYHWNTLSLAQLEAAFEEHGFRCQAVHVDTFLRFRFGYGGFHNKHAYTFFLRRTRERA